MAEGDTIPNAVVGAVVGGITVGFAGPFAPILGGGVSGYLEGGDRTDGLTVGALAGVVMLLPIAVFFALFQFIAVAVMGTVLGPNMFDLAGGLTTIFLAIGLFFLLVFLAGFGALGGYLGNYVKYDTDVGS